MGDARSIEYRFTLVDNVTPAASSGAKAQKDLKQAIGDTDTAVKAQDVSLIKNLTVLSGLKEGLTGIVTELKILGVVNEEQYTSLRKVTAGVSLFVDTARTIKSVIAIIDMLKTSEIALAAVQTYRAVLANPGATMAVAAGLGAAGGVAGYFGTKVVNQTINFNSKSKSVKHRSAQRSALEATGAY